MCSLLTDTALAVGLALTSVMVRVRGVVPTVKTGAGLAQHIPRMTVCDADPGTVEDRVRRASRWVPMADCVPRAVVTRGWLAFSGVDSQLVVGLRRGPTGELEGHAWVEVSAEATADSGQRLFYEDDANYSIIYREPAAKPEARARR